MADPPQGAWHIEPVSAAHDRKAFDCGQPSLNDFLQRFASQYDRKDMGRTFVAVLPGQARVLGYYTVTGGAVPLDLLPEEARRKLPRHPVPVAHLGRLAVDRTVQGRGLGSVLLVDAFERILRTAEQLTLHAVEVHALDPPARRFYEKYGFTALNDDPLHLYLPIQMIRKVFATP